MSVVPMQKVRLSVYGPDVNQTLSIIQKAGAVEFISTDMAEVEEPYIEDEHEDPYPRVQHAVQFLTPYAKDKGLLKSLLEGTRTELTEDELAQKKANLDVVYPMVEDFERLQVEFAEVNEELRLLGEQHALLNTWKTLPIRLADFATRETKTLLVERKNQIDNTPLEKVLSTALLEAEIPNHVTAVDVHHVAVTVAREADVDAVIAGSDAEIVAAPSGTETPEIEFAAVSEKLAKVKGDLALLHDQAEHFSHTHLKQLQIAGEILSWQKERSAVVDEAAATTYTVIFDGWLNANKREVIEAELKKQELAAVFSELELSEGEEPPVEIENGNLVKPFEAVTRLYGMPGHTDLDPTPFLAGFFFLFFGLSLTDVGYGLFLMIVSAIVVFVFKVSDAIKMFAKLLFFVGLATVLVGMLFAGYLGIDPAMLPDSLKAIQKFDPIGNPLPVFYLALSLGVFQVMVGMLLKIYSEHKNGRLMGGIIEQGPWFFTFCMAIFALLTSLEYVAVLPMATIVNLIYVGVAMVAISGFYRGEGGMFGKIMSSAARLYDSIGYFSDILSYSRLLALGLATTALAFAVNLIAGMVVETPYVGYILAGIILLIGHMFNLAVNTLGAFIHSARLQFVEFFGKFIMGTGREFSPLKRSEEHIVVKED